MSIVFAVDMSHDAMEILIFNTKSEKYMHGPETYLGLGHCDYNDALNHLTSIVKSTVSDVDVAVVAIPAAVGNNGTISGSKEYASWAGDNNLKEDLMFRLNANSLVPKVVLKNRKTVRIGGGSALNGVLNFAQVVAIYYR